MAFKCLIVDDEPLAIKLIENHISKIDAIKVVASCNSAIKAFEILNTQEIDVMLLDIKMPNLTGIDFLKSLKNPPKTILTTAYRDYAIESYDLEVIDYLLKPVTFERLFKAVNRFLTVNKTSLSKELPEKVNEFLIIKSGNKHHKVTLSEVLYIESLKDYVQFYLQEGNRIVSKNKIGDIEQELKKNKFLRVHRSYIINTAKISAFTVNDIEIKEFEIPIGVSYKDETLEFLRKLKE